MGLFDFLKKKKDAVESPTNTTDVGSQANMPQPQESQPAMESMPQPMPEPTNTGAASSDNQQNQG